MDIDYHEYLLSDKWKAKRKLMIGKFKTCQLCNSKDNLQVHHRTYKRLGYEDMEDLTLLCKECHMKFHWTEEEILRRELIETVIAIQQLPDYRDQKLQSMNERQRELAIPVFKDYYDKLLIKRSFIEEKLEALRGEK